MKNSITLFLLLISGFTSMAQVKESRNVGSFDRIQVSQNIELRFAIGQQRSVQVVTDSKDLLQYIKTNVEGNLLRVYIEDEKNNQSVWNNKFRFDKFVVYVTNPSLSEVLASSSAKFIFESKINTAKFSAKASSSAVIKGETITADQAKIEISSSAAFNADLKIAHRVDLDLSSSSSANFGLTAKEFKLSCSSSAQATLNGDVKHLEAKVSSSAVISAKSLKVSIADLKASSSGEITVTISDKIKAAAASSGSIRYFGNPQSKEVKTSSSGSIKSL